MCILKFCKKYLIKFKFKIYILILASIFSLITKLLSTYFTGSFIDLLIDSNSVNIIYKYTIIILFIGLSNIILNNFNQYYSAKIQANIVFNLNFSILKHIKKLPLKFFKDMDTVYLNQRINGDSNILVNFALSVIIGVTIQIMNFILIVILLAKKDINILCIVLLSIPLYVLLYLKFRRKLYETNYEFKEEQNKFFSYMHNQLDNIKFIKINSLFKKLDESLLDKFPTFLSSVLKNYKFQYLFSSTNSIVENFFNVILFFYGGLQIFNKNMSIGTFIIIKNYYSFLLSTISSFVETVKLYPDTLVSYNRIKEILNIKQELNGTKIIKSIDSIKLKNVKFSFNEENYIINNLEYTFEKGNVYLITGDNGIGKSTLINVILGLYIEEYDGYIYYNDINIKEIDLYRAREKLIGVLEQEPLLNDLKNNLDAANTNLIEFWINKLKIGDLNKRLIYENISQVKVSGGEKQKLALLRVLLKNSDVLIMDEPTSALDIESVDILKGIISEIKNDKIILLISHNESLKSCSDYILKL
ncbi:hypothetical protein B2H86_02730 [Clostridium botulinum]|uniref:ATP-binding cassette domain-containing protein n=1 Tax=Clostridium botulinum TaxID=1491 RepID=UPI000A17847F|nr:ABC transporter ATP-binding protein [Clostridium botulinum]MBY6864564.1 ABC transporter ATP-binding protein [Clostridium botulinum]OSA77076.1 hypothetical protein B2H86_02730 [Clostridium botulinum]